MSSRQIHTIMRDFYGHKLPAAAAADVYAEFVARLVGVATAVNLNGLAVCATTTAGTAEAAGMEEGIASGTPGGTIVRSEIVARIATDPLPADLIFRCGLQDAGDDDFSNVQNALFFESAAGARTVEAVAVVAGVEVFREGATIAVIAAALGRFNIDLANGASKCAFSANDVSGNLRELGVFDATALAAVNMGAFWRIDSAGTATVGTLEVWTLRTDIRQPDEP